MVVRCPACGAAPPRLPYTGPCEACGNMLHLDPNPEPPPSRPEPPVYREVAPAKPHSNLAKIIIPIILLIVFALFVVFVLRPPGIGKCRECNGTGRQDCTFCEMGKKDCPFCTGGCNMCNARGFDTCTFCEGQGSKACFFCKGR